LSKQLRLDVAQLTDVGRKRPHNEDNMAYVIPKDPQVMTKKGALFIVADGMGGHAAGEVASEIAVDTVSYAYYQEDNEDIAVSLMHAIKRANTLIHQRAAENMLRSGMGTTCVAGVLRGGTAYIANVGDSRTYLVRNGQVRQISQDHSWVAEQVRAGLLTEEQARSHAQRNVITRCLGTQADVEVDIFAEELQEGDSFILCSDGLSGFVSDDDLRAIINQYVPQESVYHLVERANENGGPDNITAIVVRVQEVGWESPAARRNGHANGHDITNQTTLTDAQTPGFALQEANGYASGASSRVATGPLHPSESVTAPQPALQLSSRKRGRLLYPTLVLFILLIVTLVGSGIYYFLHINNPANFDASFNKAQTLIKQGQGEADPTQALQMLSNAQSILLSLQSNALTDTQKKQVNTLLNTNFATAVKSAAVSYNAQSSITALPCKSTSTAPIDNGGTNAFANGIATIQSGNSANALSYILGEDYNLYQLNGNKIIPSYQSPTNTKILSITSDGSRLLALTGTGTQGAISAPYNLLLLTPDGSGVFKQASSSLTLDAKFTNGGGNTPMLLTAWGMDVYVVLTSRTSPTNLTILSYTVDKNNKLGTASGKYDTTLSTSNQISSIAAFPNHQLFLLAKDGSVQSLTLGTAQALPLSVSVQHAIAYPIPFDIQDFNPTARISLPAQQQSKFLQLPGAKLLVAGAVNGVPHLYVVDDTTYHRVLNLEAVTNATTVAAVPGTTATRNATATPATSVTMQLDHQYASQQLFLNVKGIVADPKATQVYLIAQNVPNSPGRNLITIDMTQNAPCTP